MPDPYWENIGKSIKPTSVLTCANCRGTLSVFNKSGICQKCKEGDKAKCSRCGAEFMADRGRKTCLDCRGERSEEGVRTQGDRIRDGNKIKKDDDP